MKVTLLLALGLILAGCCGGARGTTRAQQWMLDNLKSQAREAVPGSPPDHPDHVPAVRHRTWISTGGIRAANIGHWAEALWFPEWQLEANIEPEEYGGPPILHVFRSEYPLAGTQPGLVFIPAGEDPRQFYQGARETVQVPWDLARRVKATFDLQERLKGQQRAVGREVDKSGFIREVMEGDTRQ